MARVHKFKLTTLRERMRFVWLWQKGMTARYIADENGTSVTTVCRWLRQWRRMGNVYTKPRGGRAVQKNKFPYYRLEQISTRHGRTWEGERSTDSSLTVFSSAVSALSSLFSFYCHYMMYLSWISAKSIFTPISLSHTQDPHHYLSLIYNNLNLPRVGFTESL